jgi:hypothetical protein
MSASTARRRPYLVPPDLDRVAPRSPTARGVAVFLDVPAGDGSLGDTELLGLAETLHELARELVPGATTHTEVTLAKAPAPAPTASARPASHRTRREAS